MLLVLKLTLSSALWFPHFLPFLPSSRTSHGRQLAPILLQWFENWCQSYILQQFWNHWRQVMLFNDSSRYYVSKKKRAEVESSSMLTCIRGIQTIMYEMGLPVSTLEVPILSNPDHGTVADLDDKFANHHSIESGTRILSILSDDNTEKIFCSDNFKPDITKRFRNRFVFAFFLAQGTPTTELLLVKVDKLIEEIAYIMSTLVCYPYVGSRCS